MMLLVVCGPASACGPEALGTSRTLAIGGTPGLEIGFKTYPRTLALADHEVVLTFDDGPVPGPTSRILDSLAAECVQATFFLIGRNAAAHPALVRREVTDGHTIAHHSMTHPGATLRRQPFEQAKADIERGMAADDVAAYGETGKEPRVPFFRFPGFADSPALNEWLMAKGITIFGTDIWASDWNTMSGRAEMELVLNRLERDQRGIILFHDSKTQTAAMLPALLKELKARNYRIVHIVPGTNSPPLRPADTGWHSETARILKSLGFE